jgi:hypothetical protein
MENQFEDGDIVQLASGGPDMTVERLSKPLLSTDVTKAECQEARTWLVSRAIPQADQEERREIKKL